eukprot:COSAG01_NODE_48605_length_379_cov_1.646429_1_plen_79_part_10
MLFFTRKTEVRLPSFAKLAYQKFRNWHTRSCCAVTPVSSAVSTVRCVRRLSYVAQAQVANPHAVSLAPWVYVVPFAPLR